MHVHIKHVRHAAALRVVSDSLRWEAIWEAKLRADQMDFATGIITKQARTIASTDDKLKRCVGDNARIIGERDEAKARVQKLRPWATVGKVTTGGGIVAMLLAIASLIADSIQP